MFMNSYLAPKMPIFIVTALRNRRTITCEQRLKAEHFESQSTLSRINQSFPKQEIASYEIWE